MDYEKKYNEALERAKKIHDEILNNELLGFPDQIREIFPELRGLEDERIRKEIINFLRSPFVTENITDEKIAPWLAYLEKQKEQKPVWKPSEEQMRMLHNALIPGELFDCDVLSELYEQLKKL